MQRPLPSTVRAADGPAPTHPVDGLAPTRAAQNPAPTHTADDLAPAHPADGPAPTHSTEHAVPARSADGALAPARSASGLAKGPAASNAADVVVDIQGLTRTYRMGNTDVHALRGVDLRIRRGEMVAIMGASGSGKSTLMNLLGCLDRPDGGSYRLDGVEVGELGKDALADIRNQRIGFVFQGFNLLARTSALENVELPLLYDRQGRHRDPRGAAETALRRVGLGDRLDHEPAELSGGQQQRVAIARALVTEPALLLADEPTGNLDTRTSTEVMATFQELNAGGLTVLIVTHEPDIALYTRRIVELRDGRIIRDVPVTESRRAADDLGGDPA